ncbi:MAG: hypothetical protein V9G25_08245 [Acidimicrobiia bacterium]
MRTAAMWFFVMNPNVFSNEKLYLVEPLHEDKKVPFINFNIESSALVDDLASGFDEIE